MGFLMEGEVLQSCILLLPFLCFFPFPLVAWSPALLVPWSSGPLVFSIPWSSGLLVVWSRDLLGPRVFWSPVGFDPFLCFDLTPYPWGEGSNPNARKGQIQTPKRVKCKRVSVSAVLFTGDLCGFHGFLGFYGFYCFYGLHSFLGFPWFLW